MRRLPTLFALCLLCASVSAQEAGIEAERRVSISAEVPSTEVYVGEVVRLQVRVGFDLAFFRKYAIPLFSRSMDIHAHVSAPWLDELPGATYLRRIVEENPDRLRTFAVNDLVWGYPAVEERVVHGVSLRVFMDERSVTFTRTGEYTLAAPTVRFAYATKFSEDFISERRPLDRREVVVTGNALEIRVRDLPEEGRPIAFTGAVGRFSVTAEADREEVEVGEIFHLTLRIRGEGNHGQFDPPSLSDLQGFHEYGRIDDRDSVPRTVVYDLAAVTGKMGEVPPIPFVFFDPGEPSGYRTARSAPVPFVVRPIDGGGRDEGETGGSGGAPSLPIPVLLFVVVLLVTGVLIRLRCRGRDRIDPAEACALEAGAACRERLSDPNEDHADAFTEYLAARLRCKPAAVIAPDLGERLVKAGVPTDVAGRTSDLMESLVGARYGGGPSDADRDAARALLDELEASLSAGR